MSTDNYILDGTTPVPEPDLYAWGQWFQSADRHVGDDAIGDSRVSTVFLGIDHAFTDNGPPILFETMVFGGALDGEQGRCSTYEQAVVMHTAMCGRVREAMAAGDGRTA